MKITAIIIFILGLASSATAQYEHAPKNDTGIYITETKNGDKMTIDMINDKSNLTIDYQLIDEFNKAVLIVLDNSGRVIVQQEILYEMDQVIIPAGNWPSGQYTFSLYTDKKLILSRKIPF